MKRIILLILLSFFPLFAFAQKNKVLMMTQQKVTNVYNNGNTKESGYTVITALIEKGGSKRLSTMIVSPKKEIVISVDYENTDYFVYKQSVEEDIIAGDTYNTSLSVYESGVSIPVIVYNSSLSLDESGPAYDVVYKEADGREYRFIHSTPYAESSIAEVLKIFNEAKKAGLIKQH